MNLIEQNRAAATVEFALVLPVVLLMLAGLYEATALVRADMKLNHAAAMLAKMVAQQSGTVTSGRTASLGDLCTGSGLGLAPMPAMPFAAAIASVTNAGGSGAREDWESDASCPSAAAALGAGTATNMATTPNVVPNTGDSVIIVNAAYTYAPLFHLILPASFTLKEVVYARPRTNKTIPCGNCE